MRSLCPEALFFRALTLRRAAREAWLARVAAADPARGADLIALLRAHDAAGRLLDEAPPGLHRLESGAHVARYTLGRRLGEGGCGVVFAARPNAGADAPPLVALKLIKPGLASPEAIARFVTEGRALARLDHPGVPRLVDAGRTDAGDAYFAMEIVRGRRLTVHCDAHRLPVAERLELFARFCDVLGHVHDRGVRHGDLKPANILVRHTAGSPGTPVIIDFGLASLQPDSEHTPAAPAGKSTAGTLPYLSPEQVTDPAAAIDHRSDLYAAGVVLHQLLVGRTPFNGRGLDELRAWFSTPAVVAPSRVVAALQRRERLRLARRRATCAAGLIRALRGAVDALVQRALARDPALRFQSAAAFAAAIRRLLRTAPRPRPASAAIAFPQPREHRSATPATSPAHSGHLRPETPAAAA